MPRRRVLKRVFTPADTSLFLLDYGSSAIFRTNGTALFVSIAGVATDLRHPLPIEIP
jgi:hypothetical protein